jgi:hypothetical protein
MSPEPRGRNRSWYGFPRVSRRELALALEESVRLQAHYAGLLNAYDGGARIQFQNAAEWIDRLRSLRKSQGPEPLTGQNPAPSTQHPAPPEAP